MNRSTSLEVKFQDAPRIRIDTKRHPSQRPAVSPRSSDASKPPPPDNQVWAQRQKLHRKRQTQKLQKNDLSAQVQQHGAQQRNDLGCPSKIWEHQT